jgi:hypothetical protein
LLRHINAPRRSRFLCPDLNRPGFAIVVGGDRTHPLRSFPLHRRRASTSPTLGCQKIPVNLEHVPSTCACHSVEGAIRQSIGFR